MHRRYLAAVAVAAIAGGAMPAAASASLKLGITSVALQNRDPGLFYGNVKALKMGIIRTQINWANIAAHRPHKPEDPNDRAYNWKQLDTLVKEGADWAGPAKGTVIYNVWGTPRWARKYKTNVAFVPVPNTTDFRHFMRALALRYNGKFVPAGSPAGTDPLPRITHWEIWNEPNNALGLAKPGGKTHRGTSAGAKAYVTILSTAYGAIHKQDQPGKPKAVVIGGAVGGRTGIDHVTFYNALKKGHAKLDAISVHPYSLLPTLGPSDGAPGKGYLYPFYRLGNFNRFVSFVKHWKGSKFPIYVTEIGWQVKNKLNVGGVSRRQQALYFKQAVQKLRRYRQVQGMVWYMLRDETSAGGWQSGLLDSHNAKRPIWFEWSKLSK
jgi:hypothetical protein